MCGIIGYIGHKDILSVLISGLSKLEYRGYDSSGLCVQNSGNLTIIRKCGKIAELSAALSQSSLSGKVGIAHTRWATHGEPSEKNAHPHSDCTKSIALVHNGIIENYHSLKELLEKEGHVIETEVDSEVLVHLIEKFYEGDLEEAVMNALSYTEGTFGIAVMHKDEQRIVAARRGSPLVVGIGENEMFIASDVSAILNHTKRVIYLNDNEIATITNTHCVTKNLGGEILTKKVDEVQWTIDAIEKDGFEHFMLKEIFEQPQSIANTLRGRVVDGKVKLSLNVDVKNVKRIIITACGTSWHSALIGKHFIENLTRIPVEVDYASEFRYRKPIIYPGDIMVAISQSGETADTLAAIKEAKAQGATTLGIVNVVGSTIAREVDGGIYLHAGPEMGVASTKAFTGQLVALLLLALYIKQQKGEKLDNELLEDLQNLPTLVKQTLESSKKIIDLAEDFKDSKDFLYLGRGINFPVALEGALKLKEISYIHAEGYPAAEMKHGPIALVDSHMPVVFIAPHDSTYEKIISNMQEIKARKGKIIAVSDKGAEIQKLADIVFKVPSVRDELSPIINILPLQLLSYYVANVKGLDVDKPRNLAKSVTVE
ncbi:glutamine--fructose-6-phosphate transaminase (isomerizing) [Candidatus Pacearchaeota archaeon]|nr:glutamine--fructose-6-phosphate transaminase (isomerizing) [Candidatus Pacearchaeota archaeon]